ncbi:ribosomal protection-like ABC-F family protein [Bacillus thuringiensis]|uniref:ribosomal protection-like ABC-F family protein n=1 Tax=Bacillus thuringiensis TaxID=1428 RepID=UPI000BECFD0E|nr:ABC-F type ribosomal protection protein [Bacillus thuringiensis]MBG9497011.1 ABC transporter [Bacillus thuringiensis]PDY36721.1 ABC-F type ribosomal protection protein [Bacillus thuringiensis]PFE38674.1 ABC-F type ribosomal protection protein [Bacillus thuringiensis]PFU03664.1 ABC-F type ribosomal protection protein [Bacillus thuringiensis]PGO40576.1 ABC-F type ribosomal protection protein [Bacillus thuringiensis]
MEGLALQIKNTQINFGSKEIFNIKELTAYQNDRIGIVGKNGQGKTTLLNVIAGLIDPDNGEVDRFVDFNYFEQIAEVKEEINAGDLNPQLLSRLNIPKNSVATLSGGEQSKFRLVQLLSNYKLGLLLDEPTTHIDKKSINIMIEELKYYYGTLIFVSHDRYFINSIATKIWEVDNGIIREFSGNYDDYIEQKEHEKLELQRKYQKVTKEKERLEIAVESKRNQARKISNVSEKNKQKNIKPNRLASSKQKDTVQKSMLKTVKSIEKRIDMLDEVHIKKDSKPISFPMVKGLEIHNRFPIMGHNIAITINDNVLLSGLNFQFPLGKKIAIVGDNGTGKTTLLNYIINNQEGITLSSKIVFSTYKQMDYKLFGNISVLEYLMKMSEYKESLICAILSNLGFEETEIRKPISSLSGGEATRISMACLFAKPSNVLILDEPTNFIDLATIEALEKFLNGYRGTVLFTSHDHFFVERVADQIWEMKDKTLHLIKEKK